MGFRQSQSYAVLHILVAHKYEAEDILRRWLGKSIDKGLFATTAQRYSLCPSAKNGGDLGAIPCGKADADFEEACLALGVEQVTMVPVRTRHGYHLIYRYA